MPAKTIAKLYVFQSGSNPNKQYQTLVYIDGTMSCECPGWVFAKKRTAGGERTCKHLRDIESGLADSHAVKTVTYAEVIQQSARRPIVVSAPGNRIAQQQGELSARAAGRSRVFDLRED